MIRPFEAGDEAGINDGFNQAFNLQRSLEEWHWKFTEVPEGRWIMVAVGSDREVVGHYAAVPVRMQAGTLDVRAGQIVDVFTRQEGRHGLGAARLYIATVERFFAAFGACDRLAVLYGFPSERPLRIGVARLGYDEMPPQPVPVWTKSSRLGGPLLTFHQVREGFDGAAVDALWARARARYGVATVRDSRWLQRRFTGRPGVAYHHLAAMRGSHVHAWAVVRFAGAVASWAELVWDGESARALAALEKAIRAAAARAGAERLEMWLAGDPAAESHFARAGWERGEHGGGLRMVARSFHPEIAVATFPGRFYLTMGDSDLV